MKRAVQMEIDSLFGLVFSTYTWCIVWRQLLEALLGTQIYRICPCIFYYNKGVRLNNIYHFKRKLRIDTRCDVIDTCLSSPLLWALDNCSWLFTIYMIQKYKLTMKLVFGLYLIVIFYTLEILWLDHHSSRSPMLLNWDIVTSLKLL
jgi:hypothetical protein